MIGFMEPRGALKVYEKAVDSPEREMLDGVGYGEKRFDRRTDIADRFMKQLSGGWKPLRAEPYRYSVFHTPYHCLNFPKTPLSGEAHDFRRYAGRSSL